MRISTSLDTATLQVMNTTGCACPGDTLTYECTVTGGPGEATVWTGTAFNCTFNEISLIHRHFSTSTGVFGQCNNGAIIGHSIGVEGNNYTSQLSIIVAPDTAGKDISCIHDSISITTAQFSTVIPTTIGKQEHTMNILNLSRHLNLIGHLVDSI